LGELARQTAPLLTRFRPKPDPKVIGQAILNPREAEVPDVGYRLWRLGFAWWALRESETREWPPEIKTEEDLARRWIRGEDLHAGDWELIRRWACEAAWLLPRFADTCDRLAEIAQKELDGQTLDGDDKWLIESYGETLADFHFYDYNTHAATDPQDDFPLVAPVVFNPHFLVRQILYAGLARPEALYVILDVDGEPILHRGAVLSYREFPRPTDEHVDDDSWTAEVKSGNIPPPPAFTSSFREVTLEEQAEESKRLQPWSSERYAVAPSPSSPPPVWLLVSVLALIVVIAIVAVVGGIWSERSGSKP
jgi:hypothetical protein